ncbi:MAG TPA: hypothetical protein VIX19_08835 [Terriglobales bacterium]
MNQNQRSSPKPGFYRIMAVAFLLLAVWLIWQAVVKHEWMFWAMGILTIANAFMSALKSLTPRETRR